MGEGFSLGIVDIHYVVVLLPYSKVHGANMGPTWGRQDPGGPHVGHINLAIWADTHRPVGVIMES